MDSQFQETETQNNLDTYVPEEQQDQSQKVQREAQRVKYQKLQETQWLRIEQKNFSQFEVRVLDTLQNLGNKMAEKVVPQVQEPEKKEVAEKKPTKTAKKPSKKEELKEEVKEDLSSKYETCVGEEIYLQVIRPKLVEVRVVSKLSKEEEEEEEEEDSSQKQKQQKQPKKPGAGGGKKKGGKDAPKKEDLMRIQLSKDKVTDSTMKMLQMMGIFQQQNTDIKLIQEEFLRVEQAAKRIKSLKWLEMKFAALLVYSDQLIKSHLNSKIREEYAFELIYFLKNVYIKYQKYEGVSYFDNTKREPVSTQVIKDVRRKLHELHKIFHFSNRTLFNRYPRLVIDTDLNQSFSQTDVKPYQAQVELLQALSEAKKPQLIFLNTMVGTGKTVLSVAITQFLHKIREVYGTKQKEEEENEAEDGDQNKNPNENLLLESDLKEMQILYCCPLDNVRTQVGSCAYVKKLSFAVASMWKDPRAESKDANEKDLGYHECPRVVNSFANKSVAFPSLVISDFQTTLELLKEKKTMKQSDKTVIRWQGKDRKTLAENPSKRGDQYILFIDEPTVDADFADATTTKLLVQIMRYAPPITILSSATLPPPDRLPNFLRLFKKRYGQDVDVRVIQSNQFQIGCQIFSHDGKKFLPHYKATDKQSLQTVLKRLEQNPFMQRCYNANAYCELYDRMKKCGVEGMEDFEEFDLITQEIVQKKSIELLNRLLNEDESVLQKVCSELEPEDDEDGGDNNTMQFDFNEEEDDEEKKKQLLEDKMRFAAPYKRLRLKDLAGKAAYKFSGGCLVAVDEPTETVRENFNWLLKETKPAHEYIKQYEKNLELLQRLKEKKEKEIDNEDERSKQVQAIEEGMKLAIEFPDFLKINTLEHFKKFVAGSNIQLLNKYRARKAFSLEGINYNLGIDDDILLYLFAGIAIYSEHAEHQKGISTDYYDEVQNLATNGQLALIVSDDSMCYGVNYPLNHVIVYDEMADNRSLGALFQLIGRAGRVGVSWVANAYLEKTTYHRLIGYLEGEEKQDQENKRDEAYNMELQAKQLYEKLAAEAKAKRAKQKE